MFSRMARHQITFFGGAGVLILAILLLWRISASSRSLELDSHNVGRTTPSIRKHHHGRLSGSKRNVSLLDSDGGESLMRQIQNALSTNDLDDHDLVFTKLLLILIESDPNAAVELANVQQNSSIREEMRHRIAQYWTPQDPFAALSWARQLSDVRERELIIADVCHQISQIAPSEAVRIASEVESRGNSSTAVENLVLQWAIRDPNGADGWVSSLEDSVQRDRMLLRLATLRAQEDPLDAAKMVAERMTGGVDQEEATISVLHQWSLRDAASAREWVEIFPEGGLRERALVEIEGTLSYESSLRK